METTNVSIVNILALAPPFRLEADEPFRPIYLDGVYSPGIGISGTYSPTIELEGA